MERAVAAAAVLVAISIVGLVFYLGLESRYAFDRKFGFGYRFAAQTGDSPPVDPVGMDPNASLLASNLEGAEGVDEKEEGILAPTLEELSGVSGVATGTLLVDDPAKFEGTLYRDDWRLNKSAGEGTRMLFTVFATPEYKERSIRLAWEPDASFDPNLSPHGLTLKVIKAPSGVNVDPINVDLKKSPKGEIKVPTWIAKTDDARKDGYLFALEAVPASNNFFATLSSFFRTSWDPTLPYPRFGLFPLLLGTLIITTIGLLIAVPLGATTSVWLSEVASARIRETLKPIIELLASVPTVVLGYFGLMLVAPAMVGVFGSALRMESGRNLLTAGIMMGVLILPTIISVSEDALRGMPSPLRDGAAALGMTKSEEIKKVLLPAARTGLVAAIMLGFARAIGETMIVWILSGGTATMPQGRLSDLGQPARGIPDTIGIEMGNVEFEMPHYGHLFLLGLILFLFTVAINMLGHYYGRRRQWQQ